MSATAFRPSSLLAIGRLPNRPRPLGVNVMLNNISPPCRKEMRVSAKEIVDLLGLVWQQSSGAPLIEISQMLW